MTFALCLPFGVAGKDLKNLSGLRYVRGSYLANRETHNNPCSCGYLRTLDKPFYQSTLCSPTTKESHQTSHQDQVRKLNKFTKPQSAPAYLQQSDKVYPPQINVEAPRGPSMEDSTLVRDLSPLPLEVCGCTLGVVFGFCGSCEREL